MNMKILRLVTFVAFAVCALCLTAQAQKQWTYKADNGAPRDRRKEIIITITQGPNGYEVSGKLKFPNASDCNIRGTYFPATERFSGRAVCYHSGSTPIEYDVKGFRIKGKDALQITDPFAASAARDGVKPTTPEKPAALNVTGTWDFECCDKKYTGKLTLVQDGNKISGRFGETTNNTTGEVQGQINGTSLTFERKWDGKKQNYSLTVSADGKTLTGSFTGDHNTAYRTDVTATRL
ncbi:MAG: hypothetical protein ABIP75_17135 [Pyrinomonadaceae bacterium]